MAGLDPHLKEGVCAPYLINESQLVEADNEEDAVEIAAARPDSWEGSGEEYDVEPSNEQEAA